MADPAAQGLPEALVAAQKDLPPVEPDAYNPHWKSNFVTLDNLIAKTRPVLNRHGLAIVQYPTVHDSGQLVLRSDLVHSSGTSLSLGSTPLIGATDMQKLGSAITYARRYAWAAILGISEQEDDDGNQIAGQPQVGAVGRQQQAKASSPQGAAAAPPPKKTVAPAEANRVHGVDFRAPAGVGDDGQVADVAALKKVSELFVELQTNKAVTEQQFIAVCAKLGASAETWPECVGQLTAKSAADILRRLETLKKNHADQKNPAKT